MHTYTLCFRLFWWFLLYEHSQRIFFSVFIYIKRNWLRIQTIDRQRNKKESRFTWCLGKQSHAVVYLTTTLGFYLFSQASLLESLYSYSKVLIHETKNRDEILFFTTVEFFFSVEKAREKRNSKNSQPNSQNIA